MHRDVVLHDHCSYVSTHCNRETNGNASKFQWDRTTNLDWETAHHSKKFHGTYTHHCKHAWVYQVYVDFAWDGEEDTTVANSQWTLLPPVTDCVQNLWQGLLLLLQHKELWFPEFLLIVIQELSSELWFAQNYSAVWCVQLATAFQLKNENHWSDISRSQFSKTVCHF